MRRRVFESLASGPRAVGEIARELPISRPAVSQHLRVLKEGGLVTDERAGNRRLYRLDPAGLAELRGYIDRFWDLALAGFREAAERAEPAAKEDVVTQQVAGMAVSKAVTVQATPERAFAVFASEIGSWWPLERYHIGAEPPVTAVVEPRAGGRWFERAADGSECDWGRVLAWEPPSRLLLSWEISADWKPDPSVKTEVEVRFVEEGPGTTRVELEHRGIEAYGPAAEQMLAIFGSDGGWSGLLERFAATV